MGAETKNIPVPRCTTHLLDTTAPFIDITTNRIETEYDSTDLKLKEKSQLENNNLNLLENLDDKNKIAKDGNHHSHTTINTGTEILGTDHTFVRRIVWFNAIGFLFLHIAGFIGLSILILGYTKFMTALYFIFLTMASGMGITAGAHRLFSHRAYKATLPLKLVLLLLHTMAGQNCLYVWVRDHRQHHKYSDTDADPHNATRGFFFSHIGWLMSKKHPKVFEYGKKIDMSDLEADPWIMFQKDYYKTLYFFLVILFPTAVPVYLWGEDLFLALITTYIGRTILQLNFTWSVNSVAHIWGNKPYDKNMLPVETKLVAIVAGGEGWHNYHHTFPWDYRAAELNMPYNITTSLIDWLAKHGFAYDRKSVTNTMLKSRVQRTGDGSHHMYGDEILPEEVNANESIKDNIKNSSSVFQKYIVEKAEISTAKNNNNNDESDNNNTIKLRSKQALNL